MFTKFLAFSLMFSSMAFANPEKLVGLEDAQEQAAEYTADDIQISLLKFPGEKKNISKEEAKKEIEAKIAVLNNDSKEKKLCLREAKHIIEKLSHFGTMNHEINFTFIGKMPGLFSRFSPVYKCDLNIKTSESNELILKRTFIRNELYEDYANPCSQEKSILMSNSSVITVKASSIASLVEGRLESGIIVGYRCKYTVYQVIN